MSKWNKLVGVAAERLTWTTG